MSRTTASLFLAAVAGLASSASAQLQPPRGLPGASPPATAPGTTPTPAPADPYQALSFFEGNWTIAGLPAGTRFDEACTWLSAVKRHLVCRSRTESASGVQEGLAVFSYRAADGRYVYRSFEPTGEVSELEGRQLGNAWQFTGTSGTGPTQRRTRLTITPGGERSFRLAEETSTGNAPFQALPDVLYVPSVTAASAR